MTLTSLYRLRLMSTAQVANVVATNTPTEDATRGCVVRPEDATIKRDMVVYA